MALYWWCFTVSYLAEHSRPYEWSFLSPDLLSSFLLLFRPSPCWTQTQTEYSCSGVFLYLLRGQRPGCDRTQKQNKNWHSKLRKKQHDAAITANLKPAMASQCNKVNVSIGFIVRVSHDQNHTPTRHLGTEIWLKLWWRVLEIKGTEHECNQHCSRRQRSQLVHSQHHSTQLESKHNMQGCTPNPKRKCLNAFLLRQNKSNENSIAIIWARNQKIKTATFPRHKLLTWSCTWSCNFHMLVAQTGKEM